MAFRTDLALEALENAQSSMPAEDVRHETRDIEGFSIDEVHILKDSAVQALGKPRGRYVTMQVQALLRREEDAFVRACTALAAVITELLPEGVGDGEVLIVGLGNRMITPDAIGPQAVDHIIATRHLVEQAPEIFKDWRPVCAFAPGVLGQTGIEAGEVVGGIVRHTTPKVVIAVDALASSRLSRLVRTVQLTDTGIIPGAGVGNARAALNTETLGVPVIAIGVPTVVDGGTLAHEIASEMPGAPCEALEDLSQPFMITTRDIDREVCDIAKLIGYAVNMALHPELSVTDIDLYLS